MTFLFRPFCAVIALLLLCIYSRAAMRAALLLAIIRAWVQRYLAELYRNVI